MSSMYLYWAFQSSDEFSPAETSSMATSFFAGSVRSLPEGAELVGAEDGGVLADMLQIWLLVPAHVQIWRRAPLAVLLSVTSRHLPEPELISSPPEKVHFWAAVPLQS